MKHDMIRSLIGAVVVVGFTGAAHAHPSPSGSDPKDADPVAAQNAASEDDVLSLGEIIVTAQRREQTLQKTAVAISAVTGEELRARALNTLGDALTQTPAVVVNGTTKGASVTIRGIGSTGDAQEGGDPAVNLNVDGVYTQQQAAPLSSSFDVSRIEVLRGPQGTLYGRNANAGAVNVITNDPSLSDPSGYARLQLGNKNAVRVEAAGDLRLGEDAAVRLALATDHRDSFYSNGANSRKGYATRAKLLFEPSDDLKIRATAAYARERGKPQAGVPSPLNEADPFNTTFPANPIFPNGVSIPSGKQDLRVLQLYAQVDYDLSFGTLTLLPAYTYTHQYQDYVILPIAGGATDVAEKAYQGEVRLSSNPTSDVKWVAGLFYYNANDKQDIFAPSHLNFPSSPPNLGLNRSGAGSESYAGYGQFTVPVSERLRLTGGLRYTHDRKNFDFLNVTSATTGDRLPSVYGDFSAITYKAGLEYDLAERVLLFADIRSGFKAGGVNNDGSSYEPEDITAYEGGLKSRFLDNRLQANLSGFYYDYKGFQVRESAVCTPAVVGCGPNGLIFLNLNAGDAQVHGAEGEVTFVPTGHDRLVLSANYLHSRFGEFHYGGADLSGTVIPNSPKWSGSVSYAHIWDVGAAGARIELRGDLRYSGAYDTGIDPGLDDIQDRFTRSDASLAYMAADDRWSLRLFVRNIENNVQRIYSLDPPVPGTSALLINDPRTYGVTLSANF